MFRIYDGRDNFYQYDTGQKVIVDGECTMVHFANSSTNAYVVPVEETGDVNTADVPSELLKSNKTLRVYAWVQANGAIDGEGYTLVSEKFSVTERAKPTNYVEDPTNAHTWSEWLTLLTNAETACSNYADSALDSLAAATTIKDQVDVIKASIDATATAFDSNYNTKKSAIDTIKEDVQTLKEQTETARDYTVTMKNQAETAKTNAVNAKDDAVTAKTQAETAKAGAETAKAQAETAKASIEASATQITTNTADLTNVKNDLQQLMPDDNPSAVGKLLKVNAVNDDGTFTCEWADETETDLTDYVKNTDYATSSKGGVIKTNSGFSSEVSNGYLVPSVVSYSAYNNRNDYSFVSKGTLENVLANRLAEPQYELIETINVAEDTAQITRATEPNGTAYNFKKLCIYVYTPQTESAYVQNTRFYVNGDILNGAYARIKNDAGKFYSRVDIDAFGGMFDILARSSSSINGSGSNASYVNFGRGFEYFCNSITQLDMKRDSSVNIPIGTTIKIYGIRA